MKQAKTFLATVAAIALIAAPGAHAAGVTFTSIVGSWINPNPNVAISNSASGGTSIARWGTSTGQGRSGYDFTPLTTPTTEFGFGTVFDLGTFVHQNFPVTGTSLDDIELRVDYALQVDDGVNAPFTVSGLSSYFAFDHFETPNSANPCAAGGSAPCPDLVTVSNLSGLSSSFSANGIDYHLSITGFDLPSGNQFLTLEGKSNSAVLQASIAKTVAPVPVPAALPLLLGALGIMGVMGRRRMAA